MSAHEFMAGGDVPVEAFKRLTWQTKSSEDMSPHATDCTLDKLCLTVSPGDLRTVVLTGAHKPPHSL